MTTDFTNDVLRLIQFQMTHGVTDAADLGAKVATARKALDDKRAALENEERSIHQMKLDQIVMQDIEERLSQKGYRIDRLLAGVQSAIQAELSQFEDHLTGGDPSPVSPPPRETAARQREAVPARPHGNGPGDYREPVRSAPPRPAPAAFAVAGDVAEREDDDRHGHHARGHGHDLHENERPHGRRTHEAYRDDPPRRRDDRQDAFAPAPGAADEPYGDRHHDDGGDEEVDAYEAGADELPDDIEERDERDERDDEREHDHADDDEAIEDERAVPQIGNGDHGLVPRPTVAQNLAYDPGRLADLADDEDEEEIDERPQPAQARPIDSRAPAAAERYGQNPEPRRDAPVTPRDNRDYDRDDDQRRSPERRSSTAANGSAAYMGTSAAGAFDPMAMAPRRRPSES